MLSRRGGISGIGGIYELQDKTEIMRTGVVSPGPSNLEDACREGRHNAERKVSDSCFVGNEIRISLCLLCALGFLSSFLARQPEAV